MRAGTAVLDDPIPKPVADVVEGGREGHWVYPQRENMVAVQGLEPRTRGL